MKFKHIAQVAFQIKDMDAALRFYGQGLGLRQKFALSFNDASQFFQSRSSVPGVSPMNPQVLAYFASMQDLPWIVFLETGEHQFLELFYTYNDRNFFDNRQNAYGYQHLSLEVDDIHTTWAQLAEKGIKPDTEPVIGPDGSGQIWLHDPDGNRIVLTQRIEVQRGSIV
jgi:catechol 2,3-dioxygenase-like lactoylglutathione lyase family enzyme